jgi:hypothetical protein
LWVILQYCRKTKYSLQTGSVTSSFDAEIELYAEKICRTTPTAMSKFVLCRTGWQRPKMDALLPVSRGRHSSIIKEIIMAGMDKPTPGQGSNQGKNQDLDKGTQDVRQGTNQGSNQSANQNPRQGGNQGTNQGTNQDPNLGSNQQGNQGGNKTGGSSQSDLSNQRGNQDQGNLGGQQNKK